jgi:predicted O-methyltransferase YrrM
MDDPLNEFLFDEVTAYRAMVKEAGYRPPIWILPAPSCDLLKRLCRRFPSAPLAFELGSGRSTAALRSACRGVATVEDSPEWLQKTEELLGQVKKRDTDLTAVVPLSRCFLKLVPYRSFSLKKRPELLERLAAADLILIDSPPNPATREHALVTALRHAKVGALIILDDMDVPATFRFAQRLARDNRAAVDFYAVQIDHILGVFQKTAAAKIAYRPSLREIIGAWRRR